ncbi:hypothetical protein IC762_09010 [Bradyrhizobium genosp. L]|nr:hypothetical protein IC762_09010 [Bradyrhizobium genosp. L]
MKLDEQPSPRTRDDASGEAVALDIVVTRHDVADEASFRATGVLDLYEALFPANERDGSDDLVRWVLSDDVGERREFTVDDCAISYRLDSRCFILRAAQRAVGLGFFTYDHASHLIFCNHLGVDRAWRGGGLARTFYRAMVEMLDELFPHNVGVVLEVEPFDRAQLEAIIADLERSGRRELAAHEQAAIRKFLRVRWYDKLGYSVFADGRGKQPLLCRSPCLDPSLPRATWAGAEEEYWLMWHARSNATPAPARAGALWLRAVEAIYVEILAKSLVDDDPDGRRDYWHYATALVARTLQQIATADVGLVRPGDGELLSRWRDLAIDLPI